ncbi:response regulator transcription factor [Polynucleobacter sp. Latsch14-2]|jgi:DNA-binding NarL/FixJ family response regulator|uniref:response regulator transcription factor n=1 Tax=Polynucleobacter sp. Latsch14-2 TaxID=2576920 RepID=UPI001C0AB85F|nr:response regulator transcription factor [Polynucleobacter sp. Latsch14-2]MBU3614229.1 response regulator transcription factor [Polynucleobacter sp. Latsch14-2]
MKSASVLIVDDHPVYRDALYQFLTRKFLPCNVQVFSASSVSEGVAIAESRSTSWVVLLDLLMPDSKNQLSGIQEFKELQNVMAIAAISGLERDVIEKPCLDAGCSVFISKNSDSTSIYESLCTLMGLTAPDPQITQLTDRQKEILAQISEGHSNKMIAYSLNISEQTVKVHLGEIFKKIKVFNRTQAVIKAKENGWV